LLGIVAHQIAHENIRGDFVKAQKGSDSARLHNLEMICDVIAVKVLATFGDGTAGLISGPGETAAYSRHTLACSRMHLRTHQRARGAVSFKELLPSCRFTTAP
jgi:hypothetical protein